MFSSLVSLSPSPSLYPFISFTLLRFIEKTRARKEREREKQRRPAYDDFLKTAIYSIGLVKDTQDISMARMYNREKNNTSTTIYPKCHNTDRQRMPGTNPFFSFSLLSSSYMLFLSSFSSGHSFIYIHMSKQSGSYLLPGTTCMLAMVRNDSRVQQA